MHGRATGFNQPFTRLTVLLLFAAAWSATAPTAVVAEDDLATLLSAARENFAPVTDEQLADTRSELLRRMHELERWLRPGSANGQKWFRYLEWDAFKEQVSGDASPAPEPLYATYRRLNRNENGLELERFRRLSEALRRYADLAAAARLQNPREVYGRQLDALAADIEAYRGQPTAALELAIANRLDVIAGLGQAPELVAAVRSELARPNAFINISTALLAAAAEPFDRREPVTDFILGTRIHSDAHTVGQVVLETVPDEERAVILLTSSGEIRSRSTGYNGPAVIRSSSRSDFTAAKRVVLSDEEFGGFGARADVTTRSQIHSVAKRGGGLGSRLVSSMGWQRAQQSRSRADAIASNNTRRRIEQRFDREVADQMNDARGRYENDFRRPLARSGDLPEYIRYSSTTTGLAIEATQANRGQLGAPNGPPERPTDQDITIAVHQSAVNNYTAALLGGATARESEPGGETEFNVNLPDWMQQAWEDREAEADADDEGDEASEPLPPWSLTLRQGRPVTAAFDDGRVVLTIHLARLESGDDEFTNWDVTSEFVPNLKDGGVVLVREGDLVVLPTGFDPDRGQLSSRQVALRSNLTEVLNERSAQGRGFPQEIEYPPLELSGDLARVGPLAMGQFQSDDGWVTVAWNRQPEWVAGE